MKIIDNIKSHFDGKAKALRDIELARMFWEEHNHKPPRDIAHRFFSSLGDDVDENNKYEVAAYRKDAGKYQQQWRKEMGIPEPKERAVEVFAIPAALMVALMTGTLNEAMIDEYAKEHGHENREDECEAIVHLRHMLTHQNGTDGA